MIILIFIISLGLTIWGLADDSEVAIQLFGVATIVSLIAAAFLLQSVLSLRIIDDKISLYEEENAKIEAQLEDLVAGYMKYEQDTFAELSSESSVTLVSLYPELKADTLVAKQCEVYVDNKEKIVQLKEQKINASVCKWWLYFGG